MADAQVLNFIDGDYTDSASGKRFENRSPVDGSLISMVHEAGQAEVDAAISAAKAALRGPWGDMDINERTALLYKVADGITAPEDGQAVMALLELTRRAQEHVDIEGRLAVLEEKMG